VIDAFNPGQGSGARVTLMASDKLHEQQDLCNCCYSDLIEKFFKNVAFVYVAPPPAPPEVPLPDPEVAVIDEVSHADFPEPEHAVQP
jgi:hypothetical protein